MNKMELKFNSSLCNEALARSAVLAFVQSLNPTMEDICDLKTIVAEAVSNAIIHGYHLDPNQMVTIQAMSEGEELFLLIIDQGEGIENIEEASRPNFTTRPDLERAGMGIPIMQSLSDDCTILSKIGEGTTVQIRKTIHSKATSHA